MRNVSKTSYSMHVALGTVSFTLCFAAWGLISAFAPQFWKIFELTPTQSAALVAAPVLLGPVVAASVGWQSVYRGTAALLAAGAIAFALLARNPPQAKRPASVKEM